MLHLGERNGLQRGVIVLGYLKVRRHALDYQNTRCPASTASRNFKTHPGANSLVSEPVS